MVGVSGRWGKASPSEPHPINSQAAGKVVAIFVRAARRGALFESFPHLARVTSRCRCLTQCSLDEQLRKIDARGDDPFLFTL